MTQFLLHTPAGSLVTVPVAAAMVAALVWSAVELAIGAGALALWRLRGPIRARFSDARSKSQPDGTLS